VEKEVSILMQFPPTILLTLLTVNHGMLDAALLVSALTKVEAGELSQKEALDIYETEVRIRRESAIPLSRQAAIDAHGLPAPDSPLVGARAPPPVALGIF
jgi:2-polyprenyl-6-methoxyphenol hydroxylase-like FAD-dependent oxidoreductase